MVCQQRLCSAAGQWQAACVHVLPCEIVSGCLDAYLAHCKAEDMQSRGHAKQRMCKAEDMLTLLCKLAACLCSRCKTGSPFAWSAALCSMFCHDVGRAAHTHRFALTCRFEVCCNATAGLSSLLSSCTHDLFCPALLQHCLSPALALHFVC